MRLNSIRALEKNQLELVVDLEKMEILQASRDSRLLEVSREESDLKFTFQKDSKTHENISFDQAIDQNGRKIGDGSAEFGWTKEEPMEILIPYFGEGAAPSPITLEITDYPARIKGEANFRLK